MLLAAALILVVLTIAAWELTPTRLPRSTWFPLFAAYIAVGFAAGAGMLGVGLVLAIITAGIFMSKGWIPNYVLFLLAPTWGLWGFLLVMKHGLG